MAAWVDKLLVVEATERSGALITAKYALELVKTRFDVEGARSMYRTIGHSGNVKNKKITNWEESY